MGEREGGGRERRSRDGVPLIVAVVDALLDQGYEILYTEEVGTGEGHRELRITFEPPGPPEASRGPHRLSAPSEAPRYRPTGGSTGT